MNQYLGLILLAIIIVVLFIVIKVWCNKQKHYQEVAGGTGNEITKPNKTHNENQSN